MLSNMLPALMGPLLLGSHASTTSLWFTIALLVTTASHCGYHLPLLPSPEFHDYHHLKYMQAAMSRVSRKTVEVKFNQCYGVLDRLHGTDEKFRNAKVYERHTALLGLTPLSESIPDHPKQAQD